MSKKQNPKPAQPVKQVRKMVEEDLAAQMRKISGTHDREISRKAAGYYAHICDPFNAPAARPVIYRGEYVGSTGLGSYKVTGSFQTGTNGSGWLSATLDRGPTSKGFDSPVTITNNTYAGTAGTPIDTTSVGAVGYPMSSAPFDSTETNAELLWRPVAGAVRVTPRDSVTNQNGLMAFLEVPGHVTQFGATTHTGVSGTWVTTHPRSRIIRGAQIGDASIQNVLNWHPQNSGGAPVVNVGYSAEASLNDLEFRPFNLNNTTKQIGDLLVYIEATAGTTFEFEFVATFEFKGTKAGTVKPSFQDPLASAVILNAMAHKRISGWVGRSEEAQHAYKVAAHSVMKEQKGSSHNGWVDLGRDILSFAREVGGFFLK